MLLSESYGNDMGTSIPRYWSRLWGPIKTVSKYHDLCTNIGITGLNKQIKRARVKGLIGFM